MGLLNCLLLFASCRSAWDAERSRMSAAEREAVRRLADQQKGLEAREQKLIEIR